ncbi:MAG TPA: ATP-binding cassette domain-containing protein [Bryobacteraceae bacterium]|nr:ATP-binding cassette domain-containing protein [Bryobacteraceae bacterium]
MKDTPAFRLNLHFQADDGICLVLGPSGAGKTLLLNCLGGFLRPDEGRITVRDELYFDAGRNVHLPPERRRCGYIFQDHALFPHMTVRQNVRFAASQTGNRNSRRNQHKRINELLTAFDLGDLGERRPAQLSGGQKQRAALARILASDPRILLLDEPSRGLDARLRENFYELLRSVRERLRIPIILVSHDTDEGFEVADSICVLEHGEALQAGSSETVLKQPANVEVAYLLGVYSVAPATIRTLDPGANKTRLLVLGQEIDGPYFKGHLKGDSGFLCMRRSEMRVVPPGERHTTQQITLQVQRIHPSTGGIRIFLADGFSVVLTTPEYELLGDGNQITLEIPASAMAFTDK